MASLKPRIKLTTKCNNNCSYCFAKEVPDKASTDMEYNTLKVVLNRFKEIYDKGSFSKIKFSLTGGDPFTSDIILESADLINTIFKEVEHFKCADTCSMADRDRVKQFCKKGGICMISLNEDSIENVLDLVEIINRRLLFFNVVLTEYNMDRIEEIMDTVIKYRLPLRVDHLFDPDDKRNLSEKMRETIHYIYPRLLDANHKFALCGRPFGTVGIVKVKAPSYCGYGVDHYYVNIEGYVRRCQMTPIVGHISDPNIEEKIKCEIKLPEKCSSCDVYDFCKGGCTYTNSKGKYCEFMYDVCTYLKNKELYKWKSSSQKTVCNDLPILLPSNKNIKES